jgi:hypothetical protein
VFFCGVLASHDVEVGVLGEFLGSNEEAGAIARIGLDGDVADIDAQRVIEIGRDEAEDLRGLGDGEVGGRVVGGGLEVLDGGLSGIKVGDFPGARLDGLDG